MQTTWCVLRPCFPSGIWNLAQTQQRVPKWPVPNEFPRHWVPNELPSLVDTILHVPSQFSAGDISHVLSESSGRGPRGAVPGYLQTLSLAPFPLLVLFCVLSMQSITARNMTVRWVLWVLLANQTWGWSWGCQIQGLLWILSEIIHTEHSAPCQAPTKHRHIREERPCTSLLCVPLPPVLKSTRTRSLFPPSVGFLAAIRVMTTTNVYHDTSQRYLSAFS